MCGLLWCGVVWCGLCDWTNIVITYNFNQLEFLRVSETIGAVLVSPN